MTNPQVTEAFSNMLSLPLATVRFNGWRMAKRALIDPSPVTFSKLKEALICGQV